LLRVIVFLRSIKKTCCRVLIAHYSVTEEKSQLAKVNGYVC